MHPLLYGLRHRHAPANSLGWLVCPTCWHMFTPGHYRDHLRSHFHRERRGFWKESLA